MADTENKDKTPIDGPQEGEKRELSDFEKIAEEGRKTAERNIESEADEQPEGEAGSENVEAKVTTSEAQPELKPEDDPSDVKAKKTDERLGDDKAAQKSDAAVKVGRASAEANLKDESGEQPDVQEDGTSFEDAVKAGQETAKKNHAAEVKANKEINRR